MVTLAYFYLIAAIIIVVFRCTKKSRFKLKAMIFSAKLEKILLLFVSVASILGVSISTAWPFIKEHVPFIHNYIWEQKIEQISIASSKEFIDSVAGTPISCEKVEYPLFHSDKIEVGQQAIYVSKACVLIAYYQNDNSILGYAVIRRNNGFKPQLFGDGAAAWEKSIKQNKGEIISDASLVGCQKSRRVDNSIFYAEAYSHHLTTNNSYIGLAYVPQIGFDIYENDEKMATQEIGAFNAVQNENEESVSFSLREELIKAEKIGLREIYPNAFFRFKNALPNVGDIDTGKFLEDLWENKFFITSGEWKDIVGIYSIFDE